MPAWSHPLEIVKEAEIFQKLCLVMLGLCSWEVITQLAFDWSIISRKREAHWPSFFYFYCKYSVWLAVIGVNIATNMTTKVNCQALYTFNQFAGNTAIGSASTLLMLRTIAVWNRSTPVTVLLVITSLGQWGILFHGISTVRSSWSDIANACVVDSVPPVFIELIYLYTMSFDLIVLTLTTIGLVMSPGRSSLWQLLFRQGVVYFLVAFIANMVPAIFLLINLNPIMNIMFSIPAAVASSIVACRSFRSLATFRHKDLYTHSSLPYSSYAGPGNRGVGTGDIIARVGVSATGGISSDPSLVSKKKKRIPGGNSIAGIVFRNVGAGVDSMGQAYGMDELDPTRITTTATFPGGTDYSKHDCGGRTSNSGSTEVVVRTETKVYDHGQHGGVRCGSAVNVVDAVEKVESSSNGYDAQRSFVPEI